MLVGGGWQGGGMSSPIPVVVMGVSGSGKSTVGRALAERLGAAYLDGDDLHPPGNIARMRAGHPLTDEDRWPWLDDVGRWLAAHTTPTGGVTACSALRRAYRDRLRRWAPATLFVHLDGDPTLIAARSSARLGHFMSSSLQASQQATLEPLESDEAGIRVDVAGPVDDLVAQILAVYDWRTVTSTPAREDVFLDVAQHPDRTVVRVSGEIDVRTAPGLRHALFDPEVVLAPLVVVDLAAATFIDSVGIGALVAARRWLTGRGTSMLLVCADNQPHRVLHMTGLHRVFDIVLTGQVAE